MKALFKNDVGGGYSRSVFLRLTTGADGFELRIWNIVAVEMTFVEVVDDSIRLGFLIAKKPRALEVSSDMGPIL